MQQPVELAQYTSDDFHKYCRNNGFTQSMGRTGMCWDNSVAKSFFSSLKNEMYHHQVFVTRARARFAVADYIEIFYNRKRLHSSLGYQTTVQTWTQNPNSSPTSSIKTRETYKRVSNKLDTPQL